MTDAPALYVHVADDGGLLVVDGETGRSAWVTEAELAGRVDSLVAAGGSLLLSSEDGSAVAMPIVVSLQAAGAPVVPAAAVHPDALRQSGLTALMSAAYLDSAELARDLIRRGVDLDAADDDGYTALMYATNGEAEETLALLLDAGADVNRTDREGSTALMFAAQRGSLRAVKRLLAAGADPSARRTADGLTARDFAEGNGHGRVAAVLLSLESR